MPFPKISIPNPSEKTMERAHRLMRESNDPGFRALAMSIFRWHERADDAKARIDEAAQVFAEYEQLIAGIREQCGEALKGQSRKRN